MSSENWNKLDLSSFRGQMIESLSLDRITELILTDEQVHFWSSLVDEGHSKILKIWYHVSDYFKVGSLIILHQFQTMKSKLFDRESYLKNRVIIDHFQGFKYFGRNIRNFSAVRNSVNPNFQET